MLETILEPKMLLTIALMGTIVYITYLTKKIQQHLISSLGDGALDGLRTVQL